MSRTCEAIVYGTLEALSIETGYTVSFLEGMYLECIEEMEPDVGFEGAWDFFVGVTREHDW